MVKSAACVEGPCAISVPVETYPAGTPEAQRMIEAKRVDNHRSIWLTQQLEVVLKGRSIPRFRIF